MGTISRSEKRSGYLLRSSQLRYAAAYILITSIVLVILNIYAPITIRRLTYSAQRDAIHDKTQLIVSSFSSVEKLDEANVSSTIQSVRSLHTGRIVVTDASAYCIYDSSKESLDDSSNESSKADNESIRYVLYPEITEALQGNDAVFIHYEADKLVSKAAAPIVSYNRIIGAVYLLELDPDQAALINDLEKTIVWISIGMEVLVVLFSILFSILFSRRMGKLLVSVQKMHGGDYSVHLPENGRDEVGRLSVAFNHLAKRLHQSEEVRKQFVSNASHELKTPLASIKLLTDSILQNDMDQSTMREFVADVGDEADRLTRISAKLLELTRLDTQPNEERALVEILPVADRVLRRLTPVARKQTVRLSLDCSDNTRVLATEDDIYQILFNLVENGIKYNRENGLVTVRAVLLNENVLISVEDTGVGIPDAEKPHIFERFYRVDKARSRKAGGAGLGLSIVSDMVTRNDGSITVTDAPGGGSCFRLSFPAVPVSEDTP